MNPQDRLIRDLTQAVHETAKVLISDPGEITLRLVWLSRFDRFMWVATYNASLECLWTMQRQAAGKKQPQRLTATAADPISALKELRR